ncbi:MAG: hypothetical protein J1F33_05410 [Clostridiales bacterium]|nr:hypothetical protein [Clostridiales bacterium]
MKKALCFVLIFIVALTFGPFLGCANPSARASTCSIVFEDNPDVYTEKRFYTVNRYDNLTVRLIVSSSLAITDVNYDDYSLFVLTDGTKEQTHYSLTLHNIKYSAVVRFTVQRQFTLIYDVDGQTTAVTVSGLHLRPNTLAYDPRFLREGFVPIGWNTLPDGGGVHVGFGSRTDGDGEALTLYCEYMPALPPDCFSYETDGESVAITGLKRGIVADLVIPFEIDGLPVTSIKKDAFAKIDANSVVLPPTLERIEKRAFGILRAKELYFFDNLREVWEESFGDYSITRLHINAAVSPVYSINYFATLADKVDRLYRLRDEKKLVFFNGSAARFGYDSPMFATEFPDYKIVNMGVYAYSNMLPQAMVLCEYLRDGDVVLGSPELDTIETQFCRSNVIDESCFCLFEANYDMFALVDCSGLTNLFGSFKYYNDTRKDMPVYTYDDSPVYYTEDGYFAYGQTYNAYGDYIFYREDNVNKTEFSPGRKAYYNPDYITDADFAGINAMYESFGAAGADVYFAFSPRSKYGLSHDTTDESIARLDAVMRERLCVPVISHARDAILDPLYFYGTDNHLSTNGVKLWSKKTISELKTAMGYGV